MSHQVRVPRQYREGRGVVWAESAMERYVSMYERAWWSCMEDRAIDIRYRYTQEDLIVNGWPAAVDGYRDGYTDADTRIRLLIADFGAEAVQTHLLDVTGLGMVKPNKRQSARHEE